MPTALCLQRLELRCLKIGNLKEEKVFQRRQLRNLDGGTVTENQGHENSVLVRALFIQSTLQVTPGVSIKFELGSWLKKNNRLYEQGAIRPINLGRGGLGACSPRKFWNLEALKCHFQHSGHQIITQARLEIIVFAWPFDVKKSKKKTFQLQLQYYTCRYWANDFTDKTRGVYLY